MYRFSIYRDNERKRKKYAQYLRKKRESFERLFSRCMQASTVRKEVGLVKWKYQRVELLEAIKLTEFTQL